MLKSMLDDRVFFYFQADNLNAQSYYFFSDLKNNDLEEIASSQPLQQILMKRIDCFFGGLTLVRKFNNIELRIGLTGWVLLKVYRIERDLYGRRMFVYSIFSLLADGRKKFSTELIRLTNRCGLKIKDSDLRDLDFLQNKFKSCIFFIIFFII